MNSGTKISTETPLNTQLQDSVFKQGDLTANPRAALRSATTPNPGPVVVDVPRPPTNLTSVSEVVFIDRSLPGYQQLLGDIRGRRPDVTVVELDPAQDGIAQITTALTTRFKVRGQVHIVSAGNQGTVKIAAGQLNNRSVNVYSNSLRSWNSSLEDGAAILFYGSNVGSGNGGQLLRQISQLTGASVFASDDVTGNRGDWNLEVKVNTGAIASTIFSSALQQSYGFAFTL